MADGTYFVAQVAVDPKKPFDFRRFMSEQLFRQEEPWTPAQAFLCIIVAAAMCDGNMSPEESEQVLSTIHRSRLFKQASGDDLRAMNSLVIDRLEKRGKHAIADACAALPQEFALAAFTHALDIVLADGNFVRAEGEYLDGLMKLLGVAEAEAAKIAEVIGIKNAC